MLRLWVMVLLLALAMPFGGLAEEPAKLQHLKQLRREIEQRKRAAEQRARQERELLKRLKAAALRAGEIEGELKVLEGHYEEIGRRMEVLQREIASLEARSQRLQDRLKKRLLALCRLRRSGVAELLLEGEGYGELLRRLRLLSILLKADRELLLESHRLIQEREQRWHALREVQRELTKKAQQIEQKRQALKEERESTQKLLAAVKAERREELRRIAELRRRERALRKLIEGLKEAPGAGIGKGRLPPPVRGKAVTLPGRRGIAFLCPEEAEVKAVKDGRVVFASWFDGYGNLMIIDHGQGYHTVYAHAKRLLKEVGEEVKAGETIALAGSTGSAKRPMLYFELRFRGRPKSPTKWLALPDGR